MAITKTREERWCLQILAPSEPRPTGKPSLCLASPESRKETKDRRERGEPSVYGHPCFPSTLCASYQSPIRARVSRVLRTIPSLLVQPGLERGAQYSASAWAQNHPDQGLIQTLLFTMDGISLRLFRSCCFV